MLKGRRGQLEVEGLPAAAGGGAHISSSGRRQSPMPSDVFQLYCSLPLKTAQVLTTHRHCQLIQIGSAEHRGPGDFRLTAFDKHEEAV